MVTYSIRSANRNHGISTVYTEVTNQHPLKFLEDISYEYREESPEEFAIVFAMPVPYSRWIEFRDKLG